MNYEKEVGRALCFSPEPPEGRGHVSLSRWSCLRSGQCFLHEAGGSLRESVSCPASRRLPAPTPPEGPGTEGSCWCHPKTPTSHLLLPELSPLLLGGWVTRSFSEAPLRGEAGPGEDRFQQKVSTGPQPLLPLSSPRLQPQWPALPQLRARSAAEVRGDGCMELDGHCAGFQGPHSP